MTKLIGRKTKEFKFLKYENKKLKEELAQIRQDAWSILNFLEGNVEKQKIINYINKYLLNE